MYRRDCDETLGNNEALRAENFQLFLDRLVSVAICIRFC
jgi:hypothetical protein